MGAPFNFNAMTLDPNDQSDEQNLLDTIPAFTALDFVDFTQEDASASDFQLPLAKRRRVDDGSSIATRVYDHAFMCEVCGHRFPLKKTLNRHLQTVHQQRTFQCPDCPRKFNRKDIMTRHHTEQHGEKADEAGTVECMTCGDNVRERALEGHLKSRKCREGGNRHGDPGDAATIQRHKQDGTSVFTSLGIASLSNPFYICAHLLRKFLLPVIPLAEFYKLYEYAIRTLAISLDLGTLDDDRFDAMYIFAMVDIGINGTNNIEVHRSGLSYVQHQYPTSKPTRHEFESFLGYVSVMEKDLSQESKEVYLPVSLNLTGLWVYHFQCRYVFTFHKWSDIDHTMCENFAHSFTG